MSTNDEKKPARKGPRLPRLPKTPKVPQGPRTPSDNPFASRFAATVSGTSSSDSLPEELPAASAPLVIVSAATPLAQTHAQTQGYAQTQRASAALPDTRSLRTAAGVQGSSQSTDEIWSGASDSMSLDDFDVAQIHGDGVDDFAALFAEVMDDGDLASSPSHPESRSFLPTTSQEDDWSNGSGEDLSDDLEDVFGEDLSDDLPDDFSGDLSDDFSEDLSDDQSENNGAFEESWEDDGVYEDDDVSAAINTADDQQSEEESRNYLRIFNEEVKPLPLDQRVAEAHLANAERLHAFCYDSANTRVVQAVMENTHVGFSHARLIMAHHHSSVGLEMVGRNAAFLGDAGVQRALFKNPLAPQGLLRRIVQSKPLSQVYTLAISRELTAKVKTAMRLLFRKKFQASGPEVCAALILKTEARCLGILAGIPLSAKTCAILCGRPIHSTIMIQNLARFPATLPRLLEHMFRQPAVKRNATLRNMVLRHPNAPSQLKRAQK